MWFFDLIDMKKKKTNIIIIIFLAIVILFSILDGYHCPIKSIIGLSCPTCGITRAIICAVQLNFEKAFHYHMLWPIVPIGFIFYILYELKIIKINKKVLLSIAYIICIINLVYYFYRLFSGSNIVYFDFTESLIYKLIKIL